MKRTVLKFVIGFELVWGALCVLVAALLCLLGLPAFMSTISGTTSLLLIGEDSEALETSFVMAAGGIMLLMQGTLNVIQAILGKRALRHGDFGKYIFVCGVIACSTIFELAGGINTSVPTSAATVAFQVAIAALAWTIQRETKRSEQEQKDQPAPSARLAQD